MLEHADRQRQVLRLAFGLLLRVAGCIQRRVKKRADALIRPARDRARTTPVVVDEAALAVGLRSRVAAVAGAVGGILAEACDHAVLERIQPVLVEAAVGLAAELAARARVLVIVRARERGEPP